MITTIYYDSFDGGYTVRTEGCGCCAVTYYVNPPEPEWQDQLTREKLLEHMEEMESVLEQLRDEVLPLLPRD